MTGNLRRLMRARYVLMGICIGVWMIVYVNESIEGFDIFECKFLICKMASQTVYFLAIPTALVTIFLFFALVIESIVRRKLFWLDWILMACLLILIVSNFAFIGWKISSS